MAVIDDVRQLVAPIVEDLGIALYDVEHLGGSLRILIDRPGGVTMEDITAVSRMVSRALDDADLLAGSYTLEVSSPGIERPLRTAEHFAGAVGQQVTIKTGPGFGGPRRVTGVLRAVDDKVVAVVVDADAPEAAVASTNAGALDAADVTADAADITADAESTDTTAADTTAPDTTAPDTKAAGGTDTASDKVGVVRIPLADITKARTVFVWADDSPPGSGRSGRRAPSQKARHR